MIDKNAEQVEIFRTISDICAVKPHVTTTDFMTNLTTAGLAAICVIRTGSAPKLEHIL